MKRIITALAVGAAVIFSCGEAAYATPSTTYWTPTTSDVQPYKIVHLGIDNYFTIGKTKTNERGALPTDIGVTVGVLPYEKLQLELGVDYLEPTTDPFFFNAKLGTPEGSLFEGSPAINLGIFNAGTDRKSADKDGDVRTDYDIVDFIVGKTLPYELGRLHVGAYYGNNKALINRNGKKDNAGFLIGWDKGIVHKKDADGSEWNKWVFAADWASGKNYIGGGGVGVYHYFTKDISLLTGPVWFNDPVMAGPGSAPDTKWVWTTQLDINI